MTVVQGQIETSGVAAVVNAANAEMQDGAGVSGALYSRDRQGLAAAVQATRHRRELVDGRAAALSATTDRSDPLFGETDATYVGHLPAFNPPNGPTGTELIVHAVAPILAGGPRAASVEERVRLAAVVRNALYQAELWGMDSVIFPVLGAGVYGWREHEALAVMLQVLRNTPTTVSTIQVQRFVAGLGSGVHPIRDTDGWRVQVLDAAEQMINSWSEDARGGLFEIPAVTAPPAPTTTSAASTAAPSGPAVRPARGEDPTASQVGSGPATRLRPRRTVPPPPAGDVETSDEALSDVDVFFEALLVGKARQRELAQQLRLGLPVEIGIDLAVGVDGDLAGILGDGDVRHHRIAVRGDDQPVAVALQRAVAGIGRMPPAASPRDSPGRRWRDRDRPPVSVSAPCSTCTDTAAGRTPRPSCTPAGSTVPSAELIVPGRCDLLVVQVGKLGAAGVVAGGRHVGEVVRDHLDPHLLGAHAGRGDGKGAHVYLLSSAGLCDDRADSLVFLVEKASGPARRRAAPRSSGRSRPSG